MSEIKEMMINIITNQPEDSSFDEILHELRFNSMVNRGLSDSLNNKVISTEKLIKEVENW
ncbi:MAG: hypothetical protein PQJ46_14950 [Spirochaetales bacterium]|nr:hypothetical protein [Spirochaetales bacterium]